MTISPTYIHPILCLKTQKDNNQNQFYLLKIYFYIKWHLCAAMYHNLLTADRVPGRKG